MQYRTAQKRERLTKRRSLKTEGRGLSRYAASANPHSFSVISGVSGARRKKLGKTPNRSSIRFPRFGTASPVYAAFGLSGTVDRHCIASIDCIEHLRENLQSSTLQIP